MRVDGVLKEPEVQQYFSLAFSFICKHFERDSRIGWYQSF